MRKLQKFARCTTNKTNFYFDFVRNFGHVHENYKMHKSPRSANNCSTVQNTVRIFLRKEIGGTIRTYNPTNGQNSATRVARLGANNDSKDFSLSASRWNSSCHKWWRSFYGAFRGTRAASSRLLLIRETWCGSFVDSQPESRWKKCGRASPIIYDHPSCRSSTVHIVSLTPSLSFFLRNKIRYNWRFNQSLLTRQSTN